MVEYYHDMVDVVISILIISKLNVSFAIFLGNLFYFIFFFDREYITFLTEKTLLPHKENPKNN
jgi:hypothetical protein